MKSTWIGMLSLGPVLDRLGSGSLLPSDRQREEKHGSLADFPFGPDAPAVPVHDALHGRKPDAGAGVLGCRMQALKRSEKLVGIGHVEARPVVADKKGRAPAILQGADFDAGPGRTRRSRATARAGRGTPNRRMTRAPGWPSPAARCGRAPCSRAPR